MLSDYISFVKCLIFLFFSFFSGVGRRVLHALDSKTPSVLEYLFYWWYLRAELIWLIFSFLPLLPVLLLNHVFSEHKVSVLCCHLVKISVFTFSSLIPSWINFYVYCEVVVKVSSSMESELFQDNFFKPPLSHLDFINPLLESKDYTCGAHSAMPLAGLGF